MKKHIFITPLLTMITLISLAQDVPQTVIEKKYFLGASMGPSFPVSRFGTTKYFNSGFAKTGYDINLNFGAKVYKSFGIAASGFFGYYKLYKGQFDIVDIGGPTVVNIAGDHWQYHGIVVGPMASFKISKDLYIDIKSMAGIASANFPVFKYQNAVSPEKWKTAFDLRMGTNLRYNVSSQVSLFTDFDYNYLQPKWKFSEVVDGQTVKTEYSQHMESINFNVGVGYNF